MRPVSLAPAELLGTHRPEFRPGTELSWARFVPGTDVEGPGRRAALWVQGCSVHCPGCFNPHLWTTRGGERERTEQAAERFVADAVAASSEGLTLLGGEPFDQAEASAVVAEAFHSAGLSVMTFTGYRLELLQEWATERADIARLLAATDLLADGPYLADLPDSRRPWVGSTNQGLRALTDVYADAVRSIELTGASDGIEVRIRRDGMVEVNGWANVATLESLLDQLGVRDDKPKKRVGAR
jgi:anaerobic ribonucleoside-triphosphate reductase activating protein